jgi:hypothetical protein
MTRNLWVLGTVAVFGVSAIIAGVGDTRTAAACDETAKAVKTASATTSSCCAKDGAKTASVDAKKVHDSMIKSAVVAPGASPILNIAAFGAMLTASPGPDCDWCPGAMTAAECAALMQASGCAAKAENVTTTASYQGCARASAAKVASTQAAHCSEATVAAHEGCSKSTANAAVVASLDGSQPETIAAGGEGCASKSTAAAAGAGGCCASKSVSTAGTKEKCASTKTASLKGVVDEMPYRESKRIVLAGSYACGHCTLDKTDDCAPLLKTADGKVYPLLENPRAAEMRASTEGKNVEVTGLVKKVDGVKYLDVKSYKVL